MAEPTDKPTSDLARKLAGRFLVIDGPDGAGKTTQLKLLAEALSAAGALVREVRDPGSTEIGDKIRSILLERDHGGMGRMCETFLFMASRAQLVCEVIRPALGRGELVLCDRFISATVAYQGALGVDRKFIIELGNHATEGLWPDLTIILDLSTEVGMGRIGIARKRLKDDREPEFRQHLLFGDRLETRTSEYHHRVRNIFRSLSDGYPSPVRYVEAEGKQEVVLQRVLAAISGHFETAEPQAERHG